MSQQPQQPYNGHPGMAPTAPGSTILQVQGNGPQAPPTPQAPQATPQAPPTPQVRVSPVPVPQVYGQQAGLPMVRHQQAAPQGPPNPVAQVGKLLEEHRRDLAAAGMGALLLTLLQRR